VVNAGVSAHRVAGLDPPAEADFDRVMHTNVLGPMRMLPQIAESLARGGRIAVLSSRMGSIGGRSSAGSSLYRASKAALNSVLKDASLVLGGRAICVAFHPGWVRTDMGGAGADLDVATSVADMRRVIAGLRAQQSGSFLDHDGTTIPW
jgi:NAD(P)-dependent dehydrogenase (short-subunit alcohol dehydrogenase family)